MKKNIGTIDRSIRLVFAATVLVLFLLGVLNTTAAVILGALAVIFLATSIVGVCPLYLPFGLSTRKKN